MAYKPPVDLAVVPVPAVSPPAATQTAASRSLTTMIGGDPRFGTAPPGAMLTAGGSF